MTVWFVIIGTFETVKMLQVLTVLSVAEILPSVISGSRARNTFLQTFPELLNNKIKRSGARGIRTPDLRYTLANT
ncbi:MAG: hypothetical protein QOK80_11255 [Nitrososphaeraceae archaeon]|nr:hypothetical protein [Nitrososphaeraceae archaeon]